MIDLPAVKLEYIRGITMKIAMHQPNHWPYLGFIKKMKYVDTFVVFDMGQFAENDFHHRNRIRDNSPGGTKWLTVPVIKKRLPIAYINIDRSQRFRGKNWTDLHRHLIHMNYMKAAHYQEHKGFLDGLYGRDWERLIDLNMSIIRYLTGVFAMDTQVVMSSSLKCIKLEDILPAPTYVDNGATPGDPGKDASYLKNYRATKRLIDVCKELGADTYVSGIGGKDYMIEDMFADEGIKLEYLQFQHPIYRQCYPDFIPNLSSLDYIMNVDPLSADKVLR